MLLFYHILTDCRSFYECIHGINQKEYFRKYLYAVGAEDAFNFYHEVEDMKSIREPRLKQHKINQIVKRYLPSPEVGE